MSVGPLGMASSVAGTAQSPGSQTERTKQDTASQERRVQSDRTAEAADGVGETPEDQQTADRDGDGRKLWEENRAADDGESESSTELPTSRDATGQRGQNLDLSG